MTSTDRLADAQQDHVRAIARALAVAAELIDYGYEDDGVTDEEILERANVALEALASEMRRGASMSAYRHATGWVTLRVAELALKQGLQGDDKFNAALARFAEAWARDHAAFAEETRVRAERTRAGWAKRRERLKQQVAATGAPAGP